MSFYHNALQLILIDKNIINSAFFMFIAVTFFFIFLLNFLISIQKSLANFHNNLVLRLLYVFGFLMHSLMKSKLKAFIIFLIINGLPYH
jgi:hypothetical protein